MRLNTPLLRLHRARRGSSTTEYMVLIALLGIVVLGVVFGVGRGVDGTLTTAGTTLEQAVDAAAPPPPTNGGGTGDNGGQNGPTPPPPPPPAPTGFLGLQGVADWKRVCVHGIETTGERATYCWGQNWTGAYGDGTTDTSATPKKTLFTDAYLYLTTGANRTCAITGSFVLRCAGDNILTPYTLDFGLPSPVKAYTDNFLGGHECLLLVDGSVWCKPGWENTPPQRVLESGAVEIAGAYEYVLCARMLDGTVQCGGSVEFTPGGFLPTPIAGLTGIDQIAGSANSMCARDGGTVLCWGKATDGLVGNGATTGAFPTPTVIPELQGATGIYSQPKNATFCATMPGTVLKCWGKVPLGPGGAITTVATPTALPGWPGGTPVVGSGFVCAILGGGGMSCTGDGTLATLGDGTTDTTDAWRTVAFPPPA